MARRCHGRTSASRRSALRTSCSRARASAGRRAAARSASPAPRSDDAAPRARPARPSSTPRRGARDAISGLGRELAALRERGAQLLPGNMGFGVRLAHAPGFVARWRVPSRWDGRPRAPANVNCARWGGERSAAAGRPASRARTTASTTAPIPSTHPSMPQLRSPASRNAARASAASRRTSSPAGTSAPACAPGPPTGGSRPGRRPSAPRRGSWPSGGGRRGRRSARRAVLGHPAVDDAAGGAARERAGERRVAVPGDRVAVGRGGRRLRAEHERGAERGGRRAERPARRRPPRPLAMPPVATSGRSRRRPRAGAARAGRCRRARRRRTCPVPARLGALNDERVGPRRGGRDAPRPGVVTVTQTAASARWSVVDVARAPGSRT